MFENRWIMILWKKKQKIVVKRAFFFLTLLLLFFYIITNSTGCDKDTENKDKESNKVVQEKLIISTYPKDGDNVLNVEQSILISFSKQVKSDDFSFKMTPDPGGWKVLWKSQGKYAILIHRNAFEKACKYKLEILVRPGKQGKIVHFTAYGPSSIEIIEEDARKGILDLDTAWIYRFQALFESHRLPPKYQSATPIHCGTSLMRDFMEIKDRLQPSTLDKLTPYIVPPTHPDSIIFQQSSNEPSKDNATFFNLISIAHGQQKHQKRLPHVDSKIYPTLRVVARSGTTDLIRSQFH